MGKYVRWDYEDPIDLYVIDSMGEHPDEIDFGHWRIIEIKCERSEFMDNLISKVSNTIDSAIEEYIKEKSNVGK